MVTSLLLFHVGSLSCAAVFLQLIPGGLSTGSSSSSTVPTYLCSTGPILQELLQHWSLWAAVLPDHLLHYGLISTGCSYSPGLLLQGLSMGCSFLHTTSTAALWALPWLHGGGSTLYGAHGLQGSVCSTMDLFWAAGCFCSASGAPSAFLLHCTDLCGCRVFPLIFSQSPTCSCTALCLCPKPALSEAPSALLRALLWPWWFPFGTAGAGSHLICGCCCDLLRGHPCNTLLPKPSHRCLIQRTSRKFTKLCRQLTQVLNIFFILG